MSDCELQDLGFDGGPSYTWCNRREGTDRICERLDRQLASSLWVETFPGFEVQHGSISYSDHIPVWLSTEGVFQQRRGKKMFMFEPMWVGHTECEQLIGDSWQGRIERSTMADTMRMIKECSVKLTTWN